MNRRPTHREILASHYLTDRGLLVKSASELSPRQVFRAIVWLLALLNQRGINVVPAIELLLKHLNGAPIDEEEISRLAVEMDESEFKP